MVYMYECLVYGLMINKCMCMTLCMAYKGYDYV